MQNTTTEAELSLHKQIAKLNEGWAVYDCGDGNMQIQRNDEEAVFEDDEQAIMHVIEKALQDAAGIHAKAIALVSESNEEERLFVEHLYKKMERQGK